MFVSTVRRTTTGVALVTALALIGGGAASAQRTEPQIRTSVSIHAVKPVIKPGGKTTIRGALVVPQGPPPAGSELTLEAKADWEAGFTPIGIALTGARGGVRLSVTPAVTTHYRWDFAGADGLKPSHSGVARVRVHVPAHPHRRLVTSLSIRASKRPNAASGAALITARLRSHAVELGGKSIILLSKVRGTTPWVFEGAKRSGPDGRATFRVAPESATRYRTAFLGSVVFRASRSGVVAVAPGPNALTISATPTLVEPGATSTVSGVLTHLGSAYPDQVVELLSRVVGSGGPSVVAATVVSDADGAVTFTVTPAKSTRYRLRLPHTEGVPGAHSRVATVHVKAKTSLSIRGRATASDYAVTGELRGHGKGLVHRKVTLQQLLAGDPAWTDVSTHWTRAAGKVRFRQPTAPGTAYRLAYAGGMRYAASTSGIVTQ